MTPAELRTRLESLPGNVRGCLWAALAMLLFGTMDALIKGLGSLLHPIQVAFFRCFFAFLIMAPLVLGLGGFRRVATRRIGAHFARTLLGYTAMACGFVAVARMPLADAVALGYVRQLFLVVLAVLLLDEVVRWRRWTATAVGFLGVVIMVRPGSGVFDPYALVALLAGFFVACVSVALKRLSATESAESTVFWFSAFATVISFVPALYVWQTPTPLEWAAGLCLGALGAGGQYCSMRAYRIAEATAVEPVDYGRMVTAAIFGVFVFGERLDTYTVVGALVIAASTLYIARREAVRARGG
ncbi:MAG: EamA family transporter [Alphaproteobacteria bacterium]|nr:EamA family transporter [Alphaproteobacteria bacterium]